MSAPDGEWMPTRWERRSDWQSLNPDGIRIERCNSPDYSGDRFAVRDGVLCLSIDGVWEVELTPCRRDAAFYHRFRHRSFTAAELAIAAWQSKGET